ncbi:MAG TPA: MBL fold metallo-hydrolase [Verrucomicrobium sp.]|nr:MBL fold metallo-hydrolase [Verrucomicrobium sp.]
MPITRRQFLSTSAAATGTLSWMKAPAQVPAKVGADASGAQGALPYICITCGSQFTPTVGPPKECPVCLDERQYVGTNGQQWAVLAEMKQQGGWKNVIRELEPGLYGIGTEPKFGIGQRAVLVQTPKGNVLWDCISYLDDATIQAVKALGGISAIAISHPHYYSSMVEWSRAFDNAPIHLHEADRQWVMRPDANIQYWSGATKSLGDGLTLINTGGHFEGFQVLHWAAGTGGKGTVLAGDQPQVAADRKWVSFMYSYPNFIPLNAPVIQRIVRALEPYGYEHLYGAFWASFVEKDAKNRVRLSAERYLKAIAG